jgi:hypothetical protein
MLILYKVLRLIYILYFCNRLKQTLKRFIVFCNMYFFKMHTLHSTYLVILMLICYTNKRIVTKVIALQGFLLFAFSKYSPNRKILQVLC